MSVPMIQELFGLDLEVCSNEVGEKIIDAFNAVAAEIKAGSPMEVEGCACDLILRLIKGEATIPDMRAAAPLVVEAIYWQQQNLKALLAMKKLDTDRSVVH